MEKEKKYQISLFFDPNLDSEKLQKEIDKLKQLIAKHGSIGETSLSEPQKRNLAYPINKLNQAFFLAFNFSAPNESVSQINQQLNLESNILRFLITLKIKPSTDYQKAKIKSAQEMIEYKIIDQTVKTEPEQEKKADQPKDEPRHESIVKEKVKLEDLDKKLEEILSE